MATDPMTDAELTKYLGFKPEDDQGQVARFIAKLTPQRRALFDRMHTVGVEANLWTAGLGPKPEGVILCKPNHRHFG